jgi:hypothetical protein
LIGNHRASLFPGANLSPEDNLYINSPAYVVAEILPGSRLGLTLKRNYEDPVHHASNRLQRFESSTSLDSGISLVAHLNPRMPSPRPLPSSGSLLGLKTNSYSDNYYQVRRSKHTFEHRTTSFCELGSGYRCSELVRLNERAESARHAISILSIPPSSASSAFTRLLAGNHLVSSRSVCRRLLFLGSRDEFVSVFVPR